MKQIIRLQDEMRRVESRKDAYLEKTERQAQLIHAEIQNLSSSVDNSEEGSRVRSAGLKEDISQVVVLMENAAAEKEILQTLINHQIRHEFCSSSSRKADLIQQLIQVQSDEAAELEAVKQEKYQLLESSHSVSQVEKEKTVRKIRILEEELENLQQEKDRRLRLLAETNVKLRGDLDKAQRYNASNAQNEEDCNLACPVCLELLKPPLRIFQCPEGHILCENCKENPSMVHCPQCRVRLDSNCSRNRALEEIARTYFV